MCLEINRTQSRRICLPSMSAFLRCQVAVVKGNKANEWWLKFDITVIWNLPSDIEKRISRWIMWSRKTSLSRRVSIFRRNGGWRCVCTTLRYLARIHIFPCATNILDLVYEHYCSRQDRLFWQGFIEPIVPRLTFQSITSMRYDIFQDSSAWRKWTPQQLVPQGRESAPHSNWNGKTPLQCDMIYPRILRHDGLEYPSN